MMFGMVGFFSIFGKIWYFYNYFIVIFGIFVWCFYVFFVIVILVFGFFMGLVLVVILECFYVLFLRYLFECFEQNGRLEEVYRVEQLQDVEEEKDDLNEEENKDSFVDDEEEKEDFGDEDEVEEEEEEDNLVVGVDEERSEVNDQRFLGEDSVIWEEVEFEEVEEGIFEKFCLVDIEVVEDFLRQCKSQYVDKGLQI